ncbi:MAG: T9SS type A sorting domain-containing protein [Bacteroidota bacterium]
MKKILTNKQYILLSFLVIISTALFSQGLVENDLTTNPVLVKKWKQLKMQEQLRTASIYDTISLDTIKGILDDFSYDGAYPDTAVWLDNYVFINRDYAKAPITVGVATFDGLNANGYPYNFFASPTSSTTADSLTSKPINLLNYINSGATVNYQLSDSIYFSFYYQPEGLGNYPEATDSLVLEFNAPGLPAWRHIWSKAGSNLANNDSSWKLVMIPIKDAQLLQKGFQFRFRNYATTSGSLDHWHIDYVYLNKYRTKTDTIFEDVTFVYNTPSLLSIYSAVPWKHYNTSFMKTVYSTTIRNNHNVAKNGNFLYNIYDAAGVQVNTYTGGSNNLDPFNPTGYINYAPFTAPPLSYTIPVMTDTTNYTIECILTTNPDKHKNNDTIRQTQEFLNYYAYDDGTAETAFGLSILNSQMAEQFTSTLGDTLHCIDIYFNPLLTNAELYAFSLNVWNNAGGVPGTAIYTSDSVMSPEYAQTGQNQFTHYYLDPPLYIPASTFYIGFTQKTTEFLNVGVDRNTNTQNRIFYNVSGGWNNSPFGGSLMMHPVFGVADFHLGINSAVAKQANSMSIYPNPANDRLYINLNTINSSEKISYTIVDLYGRTVLKNSIIPSEYIDISALAEGVYFISIVEGQKVSANKFIKVN